MGVRVIDRGWGKFKKNTSKINRGAVVDVGIHAGEKSKDGHDLASIAAYNEFGTDRIPSRPFMRTSFDEHMGEINQFAQEALSRVIDNRFSVGQALHLVGLKVTGLIQAEIVDGGWEGNKASTIRRKGSDQPLIDTGKLRQSVRHVVKT